MYVRLVVRIALFKIFRYRQIYTKIRQSIGGQDELYLIKWEQVIKYV